MNLLFFLYMFEQKTLGKSSGTHETRLYYNRSRALEKDDACLGSFLLQQMRTNSEMYIMSAL